MRYDAGVDDRPVMVFDGDCGFCRRWVARWRHATGDRIEYIPFQDATDRFPNIAREDFAQAVHLIEPDGRVTRGAEAVVRALALGAGRRAPLWCYQRIPLVAPICEAFYRMVAVRRGVADRVTTALWGQHVVPPGDASAASWFIRLIGVTYAVAFISLWVQIIGLVGANGILPIRELLEAAKPQVGAIRFWYLPTLFWFDANDVALHAVCASGVICSLLVIAGRVPAVALLGAWLFYLSLVGAGQEFLRFQWDSLMLEAGFIAILMAPWTWRLKLSAPPRPALFLARWLLFRLMVSSAAAKLTSGDATWRSLTALDFHYFTQPLPPWTAWYAQHWPAWFQKMSVVVMFAAEGLAPFFLWGPRRVRLIAVCTIVGLQLLIVLTGNYGFFNILALVLCVSFLDNAVWRRAYQQTATPVARGIRWPRRAIATILVLISLVPLSHAFRVSSGWLGILEQAYMVVSPFHLVNPYGLFAIMTTDRPEIIVEGSDDRIAWKPYEFKYKPGDPTRRPPFVFPHMPRLDWQMWFAALGDVSRNRWVLVFEKKLLEGSPEVTSLLANNPFPDSPPNYLRAQVYMYEFTTAAERDSTGTWWKRTLRGSYVPDLVLDATGTLTLAPDSTAASP